MAATISLVRPAPGVDRTVAAGASQVRPVPSFRIFTDILVFSK
ncbi:hypothetical protein OROHE_020914 [Orobanche hederae]